MAKMKHKEAQTREKLAGSETQTRGKTKNKEAQIRGKTSKKQAENGHGQCPNVAQRGSISRVEISRK